MEIVPQVHRVPGIRGANVYLIVDETLTLIDTGLQRSAGAVLSYVERIGRRPEELRTILLTHHHFDHSGGAAEIQARTGAEVLIHAADIGAFNPDEKWAQPRYEGLRGRLEKITAYLPRRGTRPEVTLPARPLKDSQVLPILGGLVVVHTPGHSPGSICLYSPMRRLVFVGDLVLNNRSRLSRPLPAPGSIRAIYEASLWRLASLDFDACFFGHGPPVLKAGSRLIRDVAERDPSQFPLWTVVRNLGTIISSARRRPKRSKGPSPRP